MMDEFLMARGPAVDADKTPGADPRSLLNLLGRLLTQMDSGGDGVAIAGPADRWEDDAYIYFEAMFPYVHDRDVDVCIHDGKVNIRMEK